MEFGLQRMLLGYATGTFAPDQLFQGITPACEIRGSETETLGKFIEFITLLLEWLERLRIKRTLMDWSQELQQLLETFFSGAFQDQQSRDLQELREHIRQLGLMQQKFSLEQPIELATLRYYFKKNLSFRATSKSYMPLFNGGVTFCSFHTMRNIPFRIIYLLGMNEGSFPQNPKNVHFDFMLHHPKIGDPHLTQEDKYLFLDALLSAKEKLWISYVNQKPGTNIKMQHSLIVNELLKHIQGINKSAYDALAVVHPLESYHPEYFQEPFAVGVNYSRENFEMCQFLMQHNKPNTVKPLYITEVFQKLGEPEESYHHLKFDDLLHFFYNPTAFFFQRRLSLYFEERFTPLEDNEPFHLAPLSQGQLKQKIFRYFRETQSSVETANDFKLLQQIMLTRGILPHGALGEVEFQEIVQEMSPFLGFVQDLGNPLWELFFWEVHEETPSNLPLREDLTKRADTVAWQKLSSGNRPALLKLPTIQLDPFQLFGELGYECYLYSTGIILMRVSNKKPRHLIYLWLAHLIWNVIHPPKLKSIPRVSLLVCLDESITLKPIENASQALQYLKEILEIYWQGLKEPIPFFPTASFGYINALENNKTEEQAWNIVKNIWKENPFSGSQGEGESPYLKRCFGDAVLETPLKEDFVKLSQKFWLPFFSHMDTVKKSK